jgi:SAM-dependent methyltransferase
VTDAAKPGSPAAGAFTYQSYVSDAAFLDGYNAYQRKYAARIRASDQVLLDMIAALVSARATTHDAPALLDIGCSTGNFLLHARRRFPELRLVGGDLAESSLEECRRNPELSGIPFERLDILDLPPRRRFDVVVVNAVLYMMTDAQFQTAIDSIGGILRPSGSVLMFDFFHPFEQHISMIEKSRTHPDGLALSFRPYSLVRPWFAASGYEEPAFQPFQLPIDLPRPDDDGDIVTYTVRTDAGTRLPFRGTLFQPWCHLAAVKR